jgi:proteasome lid subunit RPN8/RPN11
MIEISADLRPSFDAWAAVAYPHEAVGFVNGYPYPTSATVTTLIPVSNHAATPDQAFTLDPVGWFAADADARSQGTAVLGIVHTHPDCPAVPSAADAANAAVVGRSLFWLICRVDGGRLTELRGWHWDGTEFIEDDVVWI